MFPGTSTIFVIYAAFQCVFGGRTSAVDYVDDTSRANYVFSNPLFSHSLQSLVPCTAKCLVEDTCYGVTFNKGDGHCQGYARFADPVFAAGTRLWKKKIRCHTSYIYDPITDMCFQLFGRYEWAGAVAFCAKDDGRVLVLNTLEKLHFYKEYLIESNNRQGRTLGGLRVNGVWTWLDGTPMSMSNQFWRRGEPSGSGIYLLAFVDPDQDGIINDVPMITADIACEKP